MNRYIPNRHRPREFYKSIISNIQGIVNTNKKNIKMSIPPKMICRFHAISIKISMVLFPDVKRPSLKFIWNCKETQIARTI